MVAIEIKKLEPQDDELLEEWTRVTDEEHILGVFAARHADDDQTWEVSINVAEYIRADPLQTELHDAITNALTATPGVSMAVQEDRELWIVQGDVSGEALIRACAFALDRLADAMRAAYADY